MFIWWQTSDQKELYLWIGNGYGSDRKVDASHPQKPTKPQVQGISGTSHSTTGIKYFHLFVENF